MLMRKKEVIIFGRRMRNTCCFLVFTLLLTACSSLSLQPTDTPETTPSETPSLIPSVTSTALVTPEPLLQYIDEILPGAAPQSFGEDFFSGSFHSAPVFSPDGNTVWWGGEYSSATIYTSQFNSGAWSEPSIITFSDSIGSYRDPFISPDGSKFYFISTAAIPGTSSTGKENLWMMEKQENGWREPQPLPASINALSLHWTVSVAENYDLYFSAREEENTDIYLSKFIAGEYTAPVRLDSPVNTEEIELTPNIAPDGSYLLFTRLTSTVDPPHLYISYAHGNGWSEPVRVINVSYCISPIVTPDRLFVIYLSSPSSFGWRDTSFIEEQHP